MLLSYPCRLGRWILVRWGNWQMDGDMTEVKSRQKEPTGVKWKAAVSDMCRKGKGKREYKGEMEDSEMGGVER